MKLKIVTLIALLTTAFAGPALVPSTAYAACNDTASKKEVTEAIGQTGQDACNDSGISKFLAAIVSILSYVAGIAAIIMIIISGFKYITSGGDSGKVGSAKSSLIYALVGIAVAALAQFLVHFVLSNTENAAACKAGFHVGVDNKGKQVCVAD